MNATQHLSMPHVRPWQALQRVARASAPFALLGVALISFLIAVSISFGQTAQAGSKYTSPIAPNGWIPLHARTASAIIAAAQQSPLFHVDRSGAGDYVKDLSRLGTPQFVVGYATRPGITLNSYFILPILDAQGNTIGAAELQLNANQSAIMVQSIDTYAQPHPYGAIAQVTLPRAESLLASVAHTKLAVNARPRLVYFNFDFLGAERGNFVWQGGGAFPSDPVWLIPGADARDHIVGVNGQVYLKSQLPSQ